MYGGSQSSAKKRKERKKAERQPPVLGTVREEFIIVRSDGVPVEPKQLAKGYGIQIGCIVRDTHSINMGNLRTDENAHLVNMFLMKLRARYLFPPQYKKTDPNGHMVNEYAIKRTTCC